MKNSLFTFLLSLLIMACYGQQEFQLTQFMYHKQNFNPAVVGSLPTTCITAQARSQWIGLDGAPQSQLLSVAFPVANQRVGVGAGINRHTIGITERYSFNFAYAYRIPLGRGNLGFGLQGSVRLMRNDFSDVTATEPVDTDGAIPVGLQSRYVPNFGTGIYYHTEQFYFGVSAPRLLENSIDLSESDLQFSREIRHFFVMLGFIKAINDNIQIQPQAIFKYVTGSPFDGDINVNVIFNEKFTAGISYRIGGSKETGLGEAVSGLFAIQATEKILFGISYDTTLSEFKNYNSGTAELIFRYCVGGKSEGEEIVDPRFFN